MKHKPISMLLMALLTGLSALVAPQAHAAGWPAALGDTNVDTMLTLPDGTVSIGGCGHGAYEQRTFSNLGAQVGALKQTNPAQFSACASTTDIAPDGTIYMTKEIHDQYSVIAVRSGVVVEKPVRVSNACGTNDTGNILNVRYSPHGVYAMVWFPDRFNCASHNMLFRINVRLGAIDQRIALPLDYISTMDVGRQYVAVASDQSIAYVPYNYGASNSRITSVKFENRVNTAPHITTTFDGLSYVAHKATSSSQNCGTSEKPYSKVSTYNVHNTSAIDTYTLPACTYDVAIQAAPFDIAVLSYYVRSPDGAKRYEVVALSPDAVRMWTPHVFSSKTRKGDNYIGVYYPPVVHVDNNGNLVVRRLYWYTPGNYRMVAFQFISLFSGRLTDEYLTEKALRPGESPTPADYAIGMAPGRLYFSMAERLYMLPVPRLAMDYKRAAVFDIEPQPVNKKLYVALGDSFASGEGVPPFLPLLPPCHQSTRAYPRLLDEDVESGLTLSAFVACSGAETDDITNTVNSRPAAHGLPLQEKLLSGHTQVITISVGGNDVRFINFAIACVFRLPQIVAGCNSDSPQFKQTTEAIAKTLPARLDKVYAAIKRYSPNAKVLVIGYPQIVPARVTASFPGSCFYLTDRERFGARTVVNQLNQQIKKAVDRIVAKGGKFQFVPLDGPGSPFLGHELCTSQNYFNGLTAPPDHKFTFHPNVPGHGVYAYIVKEALKK